MFPPPKYSLKIVGLRDNRENCVKRIEYARPN